MVLTTTADVEGRQVAGYLGIVSGDAVTGASHVRDAFAGVRDLVGGRSGALEEELGSARAIALGALEAAAAARGAHAVIGVQLASGGLGEGLLMVTAVGTAVTLA